MVRIGKLAALLAVIILGSLSRAEAVQVDASVDREKVELGRSFTYTVLVKSTDMVRLQDPQLPPLPEMSIQGSSVGSETRSQITSTPQGPSLEVQQIQRFNFRISPHALGRQIIGPSKVVVNGQTLSSPSVAIEVVPQGTLGEPDPPQNNLGGPPSFPGGLDSFDDAFNQLLRRNQNRLRQLPMRGTEFFIAVETDKDAVYVGEKLVVTYYLFTNGQVTDIDTLNYPVLDGFWKEDIEVATHLAFEPVEVQGEVYSRALLASYALYALQDGILEMDPYQAKVGLLGRGGKVTNTRQSEAKKIFVQALPQPAPQPFLGVTGEFQVKSELVDRQIQQNTPFQYRVRFDGSGNSKAIQAPNLNLPKEMKVYSVTDEAQFFRNGNSYKTFNYLIVPAEPGQFVLPSQEAYYFNPVTKNYETLHTDTHNVQVFPSKDAPPLPSQALAPSASAPSEEGQGSWSPSYLAVNPGGGIPAPPAAVWWGLYLLSFLILGVRGHRALGLGQKKRSLQMLLQRRMKEIKKLAHREDYRKVGATVVNTTSFMLGQMSGVGGGGEQLDQLLSKSPPSVQREMSGELVNLMERSQALLFAPAEALGSQREKQNLLSFVDRVERAWLKCLQLGFQSEEMGSKS